MQQRTPQAPADMAAQASAILAASAAARKTSCCRLCTRSRTRSATSRPSRWPDRRRFQPVARRSAWRDHVLPLLPQRAAGAAGGADLPRRSLPEHGRRRAAGARRAGAGLQAARAQRDGNFALEPVYCLGQCASAPSLMINDALHARVTPKNFDSCSPEGQGGSMSIRIYVPATRPRWRSAPTTSLPHRRRSGPAWRRHRHRAQRHARPAVAGTAGGSRHRRRPYRLRPGRRHRCRRAVRCRLPTRRHHPLALGLVEADSLPGKSRAPDLRPRRHHRSYCRWPTTGA
jgi:hypothetical protein